MKLQMHAVGEGEKYSVQVTKSYPDSLTAQKHVWRAVSSDVSSAPRAWASTLAAPGPPCTSSSTNSSATLQLSASALLVSSACSGCSRPAM